MNFGGGLGEGRRVRVGPISTGGVRDTGKMIKGRSWAEGRRRRGRREREGGGAIVKGKVCVC